MISYETIVPWGRSFAEYCRMFDLTETDLQRSILGCGDGPASFNAGMHRRGHRVISADPLYQFSRVQIERRIDAVYAVVLEQTRNNQHLFHWAAPIHDVDALGRIRMAAMREFLADYDLGRSEQRYVNAELPELPFATGQFDLVLCSHFLFMYSDHLDQSFHLRAVAEMCRVGRQVRVFPIVDCNGQRSPFVEPVVQEFSRTHQVEVATVNYEFQIGGNQMLKLGEH
jgi:hypothetical protein